MRARQSGTVSVALFMAASSPSCGGETKALGGAGGTPPVSATGGSRAEGGVGGGPSDGGADPLVRFDGSVPISTGECGNIMVEPISGAAPCTYPVPLPDGSMIDRTKLNVLYLAGDQSTWVVLQNRFATCELGWQFTDDQTRIEICGSACDTISNDPGAEIELMFGCGSPLIN